MACAVAHAFTRNVSNGKIAGKGEFGGIAPIVGNNSNEDYGGVGADGAIAVIPGNDGICVIAGIADIAGDT